MKSNRRGVSLIETLVTVAVMVVLASVFIPNLLASNDRLEIREAALLLQDIQDAITTMRYDNQDWPSELSHVTTPIGTGDLNICGDTYRQGTVNNWDGPYVDRLFPETGLPVGIGTVRNQMGRTVLSGNPQGGGAVSNVLMFVDSVAHEHAIELNRIVDADADSAAGTIRWSTVSGSGLTTVTWVRTVKGC